MRRLRLVITGLLLVTLPARAHDADVLYARLEPGPPGTLIEIVTLTNATLALLAPVDADDDGVLSQADLDARADAVKAGVWADLPLSAGGVACSRFDESAQLEDGFVALTTHWRCPDTGDLRQDFKVLRVLPTNYRVVLGSQLDGERGRRFAQGVFTALEVPRPKPPGLVDGDRLRRGLEQGVRDNGVIESLALLLLVFLTAGGFRRGALRLGFVLVGALPVLAGQAVPFAVPALMGLSMLATAFLREPPRWRARVADGAALVGGVGLALRAGPPSLSEGLGWLGGLLLLAGGALVVGGPLGRLLARRPRAFVVIKLALAALVLFSVRPLQA